MQSPLDTARTRPLDPGSRVVLAGVALIVLQLGFRAWAVFGSWFQFDDFAFMSRVMNLPLGEAMATDYAGHLMPTGILLSWLNVASDPLNFVLPASELLAFQALADVGALVFLVSAFGRRPGILPPLALFLFTVISLPAFIWWSAGINQLPFLAAIWWAGWTHLNYLRTHRLRWAVLTMLITALSMTFYEKTLLIFALFAFVALAYFATGDILRRLGSVWSEYRAGVLLYGAVAVSYLALYVSFGLNYDPDRTNEVSLGPVFTNMVGYAYSTGILGGPLRWRLLGDLVAVADPTQIGMLFAIGLLIMLGYETAKTRYRSKRAWLLVGLFLAANVLLITGARVSFVGPVISLEYRYLTELAAVSAISLGLAVMPLIGAQELVETRAASNFLDRWQRVAVAMVTICGLATYSSVQYAQHWRDAAGSRAYFESVERELSSREAKVPLVDVAVPDYLLLKLSYPDNQLSRVLRMFEEQTYYPGVTTDDLFMINDFGQLRPMAIQPVRRAEPRSGGCPYPVRDGRVVIPLDGPVIGGGWWVRAGYLSDAASPMHVEAGDSSYDTDLLEGVHSVFFTAEGEFDSIEISGIDETATVCFSELELGLPVPLEGAEAAS